MAGTPPRTSPATDLAGDLRQARELAQRLDHALAGIRSGHYHGVDPTGEVSLDSTLRHRLDNVALGDTVADTVRQLGLRPSTPLADRPLPDILRGTS